jgi:hypothetical protein
MTSTRRELTTNRMSKEQLIRTISDAARYAESQPAWMRGSRSNLRDATDSASARTSGAGAACTSQRDS